MPQAPRAGGRIFLLLSWAFREAPKMRFTSPVSGGDANQGSSLHRIEGEKYALLPWVPAAPAAESRLVFEFRKEALVWMYKM